VTQTNTTATTCPSCHGDGHVALSDGTLLCLNCRNEWNPADVRSLRSVPTPGGAVPVSSGSGADPAHPAGLPAPTTEPAGDVGDTPVVADFPADPWAVLHELVGTQVILEGGQVAEVVDFPDDDHVEVLVGVGGANLRTEIVPYDVIERSVTSPAPVADVDDDTARALGSVNLTVASLALSAGLATIAGDGDTVELLTPPSGWLPADVDSLPMLEQGVAYAVASLIVGAGIDRGQVATLAESFLNASQTTTDTKGGTEDDTDSTESDAVEPGVGGRDPETDVHGVGRATDS